MGRLCTLDICLDQVQFMARMLGMGDRMATDALRFLFPEAEADSAE
ncbi:hypothetical protein [Comamonas sp. Y33R10-2]|nr:hypothetical protein [Comamonas sp. Y33R10-2]